MDVQFASAFWPAIQQKPIQGRFYLVGIVVFLLWPLPAATQTLDAQRPDAQLTERQAVERALSRPAFRESLLAEVSLAEARATAEAAWPNPAIEYTYERTREEPDAVTEHFVILEQTLPLSGQRGLRAEAARARARAEQSQGRIRARARARRVRVAFYRHMHLERRIEAQLGTLSELEQLETALLERVEAGETAAYDLERVRRELADLRADVATDQSELAAQRARLGGLIGDREQASFTTSGDLLPGAVPEQAQLIAEVEQQPSLEAAETRQRAAKLRQRAARRWWVPEPTLSGGYRGAQIAEEHVPGFVAGIGLALPIFDRSRGERDAARASLVRARSRAELLESELRAEIVGLATQTRRLRRATTDYQQHGESRARRVLETARTSYEAGEVGILELIDAHRGTLKSRLKALELAAHTRSRHIELTRYVVHGTGLDVREDN